jgi:hypothetical protein
VLRSQRARLCHRRSGTPALSPSRAGLEPTGQPPRGRFLSGTDDQQRYRPALFAAGARFAGCAR